ncbi:MAG: hypothetical protein Q4G63_04625 [Bacteroidia bacterium]|nr:hypothetical protein [Bacteroidia bacterium]
MRNLILPLFISLSVILISCCKEKNSPTPEKKTEYTLKFISSEIMEFKEITTDNKTKDISSDKVKDYFGERIEFTTLTELQFKKDSLYIIKPNDIVEKYKIQWKNNELYLYNKSSDTWRYCGKKTTNSQFSLNTGFYSIMSKTEKRELQVLGQDYALKSYSELSNYPNSLTIWLKTHTLFEQK